MSAYVYRAFDGTGRLLYVGCTNDVALRMKAHESTAAWFVFMDKHTVESFDTSREAKAAEARAIAEEHPRWNVVGRSADHPDGFATSARQADWLRPERELANSVRTLRADVARTRAKLRGLLAELRMEEALVRAVSDGTLDVAHIDDELLVGS